MLLAESPTRLTPQINNPTVQRRSTQCIIIKTKCSKSYNFAYLFKEQTATFNPREFQEHKYLEKKKKIRRERSNSFSVMGKDAFSFLNFNNKSLDLGRKSMMRQNQLCITFKSNNEVVVSVSLSVFEYHIQIHTVY